MREYRRAEEKDFKDVIAMAIALWPHADTVDFRDDYLKTALTSETAACFVCVEDGIPLGYIHASLRTDYVEGTETSPVGYFEGVYVKPEHRRKGVARRLMEEAEKWAREKGCTEMGSDTNQTNVESRRMHKSAGFKESDILVHFVKRIK
jgi:aminoglycoside 6'-N-acetyltransferase I